MSDYRIKFESKYPGHHLQSLDGLKVVYTCTDGNTYERANRHDLLKLGCKACNERALIKKRSDSFLKFMSEKYGDSLSYVSGEYHSIDSLFIYSCPKHGNIAKTVKSWKVAGCEACSYDARAVARTTSREDVQKRLFELYGDRFKFELGENVSSKSKLKMICSIHGATEHMVQTALGGKLGCRKCRAVLQSKDMTTTLEEFKQKAIELWGDAYSYDKAEYVGSKTKLIVICSKHGDFLSRPNDLLTGHGCPRCGKNRSSNEDEIHEILKSLTNSEILLNNRKLIAPYEVDFYIPEFNLAIEYNGSFWHHSSDVPFAVNEPKPKDYHYNKWKMCKDAGVTLITINDFLWCQPNKREIFISKFKHFLNLDERIFARKCTISEIDKTIANDFYEENHIEGSGVLYSDDKSLGLFYGDRLVMCISAGYFYNQSTRSKEFKVRRVCTLKGITVIGGVTKMISAIKKSFEEESVKFQFTLSTGGNIFSTPSDSTITFRYYWVDPDTMNYYHRNYCQKYLLEKHFGNKLLDNDTESSYMQRLGYMKIHDSGVVSLTI